MRLWPILQIALTEAAAHKFRALLSMLGVMLGVAALLATLALVAGMERSMRETMDKLGGLTTAVIRAQPPPIEQEAYAEISPGLTLADADALEHSAPELAVCPTVQMPSVIECGAARFRGTVYGLWPTNIKIWAHVMEQGRALCWLDVEQCSHVCILGRTAVARIWPQDPDCNPVGRIILINSRPFTVVGVYQFYETEADILRRRRESRKSGREPTPSERYNSGALLQKNLVVHVPVTTAFWEFRSAQMTGTVDQGPNYKLDFISIQSRDYASLSAAVAAVRNTLLQTHRGVEDFNIDTREEWGENIATAVQGSRRTGLLIASISLLVGGINIANIVLASIAERVREIGVRRAVGAKGRDILLQILMEGSLLSLGGGLLGLVAALGLVRLLAAIRDSAAAPIVQPRDVAISFAASLAVGVISGLYPAWKASRLSPIEALRYG